jgi:hypothetical protein
VIDHDTVFGQLRTMATAAGAHCEAASGCIRQNSTSAASNTGPSTQIRR